MLATWMLASCHGIPAEKQIHDAINAAAAAARANDVHRVLDVVSDDFIGNDGELDRDGLHRLLALRALRQDQTSVLIGPISFGHRGDRIIAKFNLVLMGSESNALLPNRSAIYAMTTAWRRKGGKWRCYNAMWKAAAG